ncbi:MAG TPA: twin-arginine translocase subunit TatC, partial [Candidatus Aenigmarchaeota archaeon]|nr:twin-arginine translocase subunit TatC [Candidatus Aenigmarchaeota archaeon]
MAVSGKERKTLLEHMEELRSRLIVVIGVFAVFSVLGFLFSGDVLSVIKRDITGNSGVELIVTHPLDLFCMKINIGIFIGILACIPVLLYQAYSFIKPGLTKKETRTVKIGMVSSLLLFIAGVVFSYSVLLRVMVWFFVGMATSSGVSNLWNINYFISFLFLTSFVMGIVFQLPVITWVLLKLELVDIEVLRRNRGNVVILIFIISAIITPPDPVTQIMVA